MRVREIHCQWATGRKAAFTSPPLSPHQMSWLLLNLNLESDTTAPQRATLLKEGWDCRGNDVAKWLWSAIKLLLLDVSEVNLLCSAAAPRWMETGCSKTSEPTTQQLKVGVGSISSLAARYSEVLVWMTIIRKWNSSVFGTCGDGCNSVCAVMLDKSQRNVAVKTANSALHMWLTCKRVRRFQYCQRLFLHCAFQSGSQCCSNLLGAAVATAPQNPKNNTTTICRAADV